MDTTFIYTALNNVHRKAVLRMSSKAGYDRRHSFYNSPDRKGPIHACQGQGNEKTVQHGAAIKVAHRIEAPFKLGQAQSPGNLAAQSLWLSWAPSTAALSGPGQAIGILWASCSLAVKQYYQHAYISTTCQHKTNWSLPSKPVAFQTTTFTLPRKLAGYWGPAQGVRTLGQSSTHLRNNIRGTLMTPQAPCWLGVRWPSWFQVPPNLETSQAGATVWDRIGNQTTAALVKWLKAVSWQNTIYSLRFRIHTSHGMVFCLVLGFVFKLLKV